MAPPPRNSKRNYSVLMNMYFDADRHEAVRLTRIPGILYSPILRVFPSFGNGGKSQGRQSTSEGIKVLQSRLHHTFFRKLRVIFEIS